MSDPYAGAHMPAGNPGSGRRWGLFGLAVLALVIVLVALAAVHYVQRRDNPAGTTPAPTASTSSVAVPTQTVTFPLIDDTNTYPLPEWQGATTREFVEQTLQRYYRGWRIGGKLFIGGKEIVMQPLTVVIVYDRSYKDSCTKAPEVLPTDRAYHCPADGRVVIPAESFKEQVAEGGGKARGWHILGQLFFQHVVKRNDFVLPGASGDAVLNTEFRIISCFMGRALAGVYAYNPTKMSDIDDVVTVAAAAQADAYAIQRGAKGGFTNQKCYDERASLVG